jgi:hypothetical protein
MLKNRENMQQDCGLRWNTAVLSPKWLQNLVQVGGSAIWTPRGLRETLQITVVFPFSHYCIRAEHNRTFRFYAKL